MSIFELNKYMPLEPGVLQEELVEQHLNSSLDDLSEVFYKANKICFGWLYADPDGDKHAKH